MSYPKRYLYSLACLVFLIGVFAAQQTSAAQDGGHAGHHGGGADGQTNSTSLASNDQGSGKKDGGGGMGGGGMGGGGGKGMGGGGGGMGGGGKGMGGGGKGMGGGGMGGGAPGAELYPHLMSLPELTPEHRAELEAHAHQRMIDGTVLMSEGLDELTAAASADDYARMQRATSTLREGVTQFETGLATHRALVEGTSPRNEALRWLKQELSLTSPVAEQPGLQLWGMGTFHSLVMLVLVAFAITMLAMYYFKMQRATALLQALASGNLAGGDSAPGPAPVTASGSTTRTAATSPTPATDNPDAVMSIETDCCPAGTLLASDKSPQGLLPFVRRKQCNLQVVRIIQETPDVKTFRMVCCHGGPIPFSYLPGQFLTLTMPVGDKPIRRSYTISSSPTQGYYCEIAVKREDKGQGSRYLHDTVKEGDILEAQAPSGRFTFTGKEGDSVVLIGGGVGITPMMSITRALTDMGWKGQIYFIVAARDPEHFIFRSELKRLEQQNANLHVFAALSRMKEPMDGFYSGRLSKDLLAEWVPEIDKKWIHICGAPPMMDSTKEMLAELGVPKDNIHLENFGSAQKPKPKSKSTEPPPAQTTASDVATATVTFTTSGKSAALGPDETVLEAAERIDVNVDYSCRVGMCGVCRIKKLSGEVIQESTDGLEPGDEEAGMILACVSKSKGDLSVEE